MFLYHKWLELPIQTRIRIASEFGIIKKGSTHVVDNQIQSDGYSVKDVEQALNVDAIQQKLGTNETDMAKLWELLISPPQSNVVLDVPIITIPRRNYVRKNKAKKNK